MLGLLWSLIKFVFWALLILAIFHALVTYFVVWFEMRLAELKQKSKEPIPVAMLFKSLCIEIACNFIRFILTPFGLQKPKSLPHVISGKPPVLLLHGYLQNQADWFWFKKELMQNKEIGQIYTLNLCPPLQSITEFAKEVQRKVEKILEETSEKQIILIGHSMGGLVASYYSEFLAKPNQVLKVITLGSPFQGTKLAALGYGENVKEMSPHSLFLKQLNDKMEQSSIPYHYVASKIDNLVVPWQSALPSNLSPDLGRSPENTLILEDHGHLRLLVSRQVLNQVEDWVLEKKA